MPKKPSSPERKTLKSLSKEKLIGKVLRLQREKKKLVEPTRDRIETISKMKKSQLLEEREVIRRALEACDWNLTRAAKLLKPQMDNTRGWLQLSLQRRHPKLDNEMKKRRNRKTKSLLLEERGTIRRALEACDWNLTRASKLLKPQMDNTRGWLQYRLRSRHPKLDNERKKHRKSSRKTKKESPQIPSLKWLGPNIKQIKLTADQRRLYYSAEIKQVRIPVNQIRSYNALKWAGRWNQKIIITFKGEAIATLANPNVGTNEEWETIAGEIHCDEFFKNLSEYLKKVQSGKCYLISKQTFVAILKAYKVIKK